MMGHDPGPVNEEQRPAEVQADVVLKINVTPSCQRKQLKRTRAPDHFIAKILFPGRGGQSGDPHFMARGDEILGQPPRDGFDPANAGIKKVRGDENFQDGLRAIKRTTGLHEPLISLGANGLSLKDQNRYP